MNNKTAKLEDLCTIKTGMPTTRARNILPGIESKEVKVLKPGAMQAGSIINEELPVEFVGEVAEENFTHEGDVVIKLSTPYDSVYIDVEHEGIMVTSFGMILRKKSDAKLDMQYLSMFLNLPQTNAMLQAVSTGQSVAMAMLKRRTVAEIEVPLLPLEQQEALADLFTAVQKRQRHYKKLIELDDELVTNQMANAIWGKE